MKLAAQGTRQVRERATWWVVSTHVVSALVATLFLMFAGGCLSSWFLHIGSSGIAFVALSAWLGTTGILSALHSGKYLRRKVAYPLPTDLVAWCTIWYTAILLGCLLGIVAALSEWLHSSEVMMALLAAVPAIVGFSWQTRWQFRRWEEEQQPPKSYGFPVILADQTPPAPPAASRD